jgi:chemotaxis protein CheD
MHYASVPLRTKEAGLIVGIGDMKVARGENMVITTHSLGSCVGIAIFDPGQSVGGILHFQLPLSTSNPQKALEKPFMFADTGIPAMFKAAYDLGAEKKRLIVKVAGGASVMEDHNVFNIGERNCIIMKKLFWKNGIMITAEDLGGDSWRTMRLEHETGRLLIKNSHGEYEL